MAVKIKEKYVRKWCIDNDITPTQLSEKAGFHKNLLTTGFTRGISTKAWYAVAEAMGVRPTQIASDER